MTDSLTRPGLAPVLLMISGLLFIAFPALRPYGEETTLRGAAGMASPLWIVAHLLGMLAFIVLVTGLWLLRGDGASPRRPWTAAASHAGALGLLGLLPFYGLETFGAAAVARYAVAGEKAAMLELIEQLRNDAVALGMFGAGLVAVALAGCLLAAASWPVGGGLRLGGLLTAAGLLTYLPQYLAPAPLRIAHGLVLGAGLLLLAGSLLSDHLPRRARPPHSTGVAAAHPAGASAGLGRQ